MVKSNTLRFVAAAVIAGIAGMSVASTAFAYDDRHDREWHRDHDRHWHDPHFQGGVVVGGPAVVYAPPAAVYVPPPPPPVVGFGLDFRIH